MNDYTATDVVYLKDLDYYCLIDTVEEHFESAHHKELEKRYFPEYSSKGYENCSCRKISQEHIFESKLYLFPLVIWVVIKMCNVVPEACE